MLCNHTLTDCNSSVWDNLRAASLVDDYCEGQYDFGADRLPRRALGRRNGNGCPTDDGINKAEGRDHLMGFPR